ncbi:MAG: hypothetical protein JO019_04980 [Candidatus Kaiserbacteria bacterium]|nr:hypothetical protein [Candidatus Kaiserbacteria bacterium]
MSPATVNGAPGADDNSDADNCFGINWQPFCYIMLAIAAIMASLAGGAYYLGNVPNTWLASAGCTFALIGGARSYSHWRFAEYEHHGVLGEARFFTRAIAAIVTIFTLGTAGLLTFQRYYMLDPHPMDRDTLTLALMGLVPLALFVATFYSWRTIFRWPDLPTDTAAS